MKRKIISTLFALVLVLTLGLVTAVPVAAAALTGVSATPVDATEAQTTTYTIGFTTATTYVIDTVAIEFDTGFDASGATLVTVTGIGAGESTSVAPTTEVVTYTVTAPAVIPAGTAMTITFSGVTNPGDGDYEVTVTTRDGTPAVVDTGTADVTITPLPAEFEVVAGTNDVVTAGVAFSVQITALQDDLVTPETGYTGDHYITFTTGGAPTGTIPGFGLVSFTNGVGTSLQTFILTDATEADNTITATDELSVAGMTGAITINLPALAYFLISGGTSPVTAGAAFTTDVTVAAYDSLGNAKTDYTGTVSWTSSDPLAELPDAHALVAGTYAFPMADFTLKTAGYKTITATGDGVYKYAVIVVNPAVAISIAVTASPSSIPADGRQSSTITATAYDAFGNVATGYTESVTFTTSLGSLAGTGDFVAGVESRALTSDGVVGTATIKVTPNTLAYVTTTVTLTASLGDEVWVSKTGSDSSTTGSEVAPYLTIQKGITEVDVNGTVNVMPGTYDLSTNTLEVSKTGITVQSTYGAAVTILDADSVTGVAVSIHASNVTFDGFTVEAASSMDGIWIWYGTEGVTVRNNTITGAGWSGIALTYGGGTSVVVGATVSGNLISGCNTGMDVGGCLKDSTISGNTITGCDTNGRGINFAGGTAADPTQGNTITGNFITANASMGIYVKNNSTYPNDTLVFGVNLIEKNLITANLKGGIVIGVLGTDLTITSLSINNNNIYDNDATDVYDLENLTGFEVDAENNWWGTAVESAFEVFGYADYSPWLSAAYGSAVVVPFTSIDLVAGWNFISVPRRMADDTDTFGELLDGIDFSIAYSYDPDTGWGELLNGSPVEVLEGYWVHVNVEGTVDLSFSELGQAVPPSKQVTGNAWNAIGSSSTTAQTAADTLMSVDGSWSTIIGWDADGQAYEVSIIAGDTSSEMAPGKGYWVWITEDDVLSAISG